MKKQLVIAVAAATMAMGALSVNAYEQGDIVLRAGLVTVAPDADSDPIVLPDPVGTLPNGVDVDNDTQISIIGTWMMSDNWGLEVLAATPFEHDIDLEDAPLPAGSTKHLPPTVSLQWYPRGNAEGWQPYVGVGVNYTKFFDEEVDPVLAGFLVENRLVKAFNVKGVDLNVFVTESATNGTTVLFQVGASRIGPYPKDAAVKGVNAAVTAHHMLAAGDR